jgi:hypothetical protein
MEDEGNSKDSQPVPDTVTVKTPGATGPVFRATLKGVFSELWPLAAGAVFGVLIRILFSDEPGCCRRPNIDPLLGVMPLQY